MSYQFLKIITILIPTILIGGFEFLRHTGLLLQDLSMKTGNYFITILIFIVSYIFSNWMFKMIEEKNHRISSEREMRAIYEERERLAKELHDNIAQTLFLLNVNLKKGKLNDAQGLVNSIDSNLRQAIYNLRTSPSEHVSLSPRLESWLDDWSTVSGIDLIVSIDLDEDYFTPAEEVQIFSIIQEAFTNIRKHSNADHASLLFHTNLKKWELIIEDNGRGFLINEIPLNKYGLVMLKERVHKIGATIDISSEKDNGTNIIIKGSSEQ
ncbi:sensor histidine kinase [Neobacillus sp. PS3-40]|uniref:sensor histidine kinase n=1 Tax=Neobacillus sp. PS3-40 TaxID=3070679 RepID=UPI0027E090AB|nr:sensor histidine kinase [Neobacillus sp. PS3-40]WML44849.1 sensor histidine kinase [Neobacillus sp. PS3-40]